METTQIPLKKKTRQRLRNISIKGETYDELLNKLVNTREKFENKHKFREWFEENYEFFGFDQIKRTYSKGFPDYQALRENEKINIELETLSSNFIKHGHDPERVDIVFCLVKDTELPVQTIEITDYNFKGKKIKTKIDYGKLKLLLELAKDDANNFRHGTTVERLAKKIDGSRETVSRWIEELSEKNLLEKEEKYEEKSFALTPLADKLLKEVYSDLNELFKKQENKIKITGYIVSGFGEGSYYIKQDGYQNQFKNKLGFDPHPGTLDLKLKNDSLKSKLFLKKSEGILIEGFSTKERNFGGVKCFPAEILGEKGAVIFPQRTYQNKDIIEVISPINFRKKYDLKDGNKIEVEVKV